VREIEAVSFGEKPRRTFDDGALRFIEEHLPTLKPASRTRYLISIEALTDCFEGKFIDEITPALLSDFQTARQKAGRRIHKDMLGKRRPKPLSPATIRRDLACLSSMFTFWVEWEWATANPVPGFMRARKRRGLREGNPRTRWLRPEEEKAVLAYCLSKAAKTRSQRMKDYYTDLHDAIVLAIDTGLRSEEQFSLTRAQIRHNRVVLSEGTKNSKPREVPILERSRAMLERRPIVLKSPYVFTNRRTGKRYATMLKGLKSVLKACGIPEADWHDLRRTCGCRLLQAYGKSIEEVSLWLGHSSIEVTQKSYAFLEVDHLERGLSVASL